MLLAGTQSAVDFLTVNARPHVSVQVNYFIAGWGLAFNDASYYTQSVDVMYACTLVFSVMGPLAFVSFQYRLGIRSFWSAFGAALAWTPFLIMFFMYAHCPHESHAIVIGPTTSRTAVSIWLQRIRLLACCCLQDFECSPGHSVCPVYCPASQLPSRTCCES